METARKIDEKAYSIASVRESYPELVDVVDHPQIQKDIEATCEEYGLEIHYNQEYISSPASMESDHIFVSNRDGLGFIFFINRDKTGFRAVKEDRFFSFYPS